MSLSIILASKVLLAIPTFFIPKLKLPTLGLELLIMYYYFYSNTIDYCPNPDIVPYINIGTYSIMTYGWPYLLVFLIKVLSKFPIPIIGFLLKLIDKTGIIGYSIIWCIGFFIVGQSILLDIKNSKSNLCKEQFYNRKKDIFLVLIALVLIWLGRIR